MDNYVVSKEFQNYRLDQYLTLKLKDLSRSRIKHLINDGHILLNEKIAKPAVLLKEEDIIAVEILPPQEIETVAQEIPLDIVYEDDDLIVINKPAGMVTHPGAGNYKGTLVNALLAHCKNLSGIGGKIRPGIVHRLDKDTSGLMVVAKNDFSHQSLSKQFKDRTFIKKYQVLVHGIVKEDEGTIDLPIGRSLRDRKKMAVFKITNYKVQSTKLRNAITHFRVLKRYKDKTLLDIKLETGRTHQIRVHLVHIHHPIVGDRIYGLKKDNAENMALKSCLIGFIHPRTGKYVEFLTSPLSIM